MNKALKLGAIGAGIFILMRYFTGRKKSAENLRIVPVDIAIDKSKSQADNYFNLHYRIKINLINQEQAPVIVRGIDLDIFYQGRKVAKLFRDQDFTVEARQSKTATLNGSIATGSVISSIVQLLTETTKNVRLTVEGFVDTDLGRVPVKFTREITF